MTAAKERVQEITIPDLQSREASGEALVLIDVREDHEWERGHIPGAIHIGRGILERDVEKSFADKNVPLVLYCGGGYRSALAADNLQRMGYTNVRSLAGGIRGWAAANLPLER